MFALTLLLALASPTTGDAPKNDDARAAKAAAERAEESLLRAYRRELVYLEGQKRALVERRDALRARHDDARAALEASLASVQEETLQEELAADRLEETLRTLGIASDASMDQGDVESSVLDQARTLLRARGVEFAPSSSRDAAKVSTPGEEIERTLAAALAAIADRAGKSVVEASFFDEDGVARAGTRVSLGAHLHFGQAKDDANVAGPLLPLGDGRYQLAARAPDDVRALLAGEATRVQAFLTERPDAPVSLRAEKTFDDLLRAAGAIGVVIVVLGAVALLFAILRALSLTLVGRGRERAVSALVTLVQKGEHDAARALARERGGALGRVLTAALSARDLSGEARSDVVDEALLAADAHVDRFGTIVLVSAAVAPLLGLLGTVTGMIATFDSITQFGTGDPRLLSGGISEALLTTELGLVVAIPALLVGNLLSSWGERVSKDFERGALRVMNQRTKLDAPAPTSSAGHQEIARPRVLDDADMSWSVA